MRRLKIHKCNENSSQLKLGNLLKPVTIRHSYHKKQIITFFKPRRYTNLPTHTLVSREGTCDSQMPPPHNFPSPFPLNCASTRDRPNLFMSSVILSHHGLLRRCLYIYEFIEVQFQHILQNADITTKNTKDS